MTATELAALLELAVTGLADIATLPDGQAQHKAQRIYTEIRAQWAGPGPEDDAPG